MQGEKVIARGLFMNQLQKAFAAFFGILIMLSAIAANASGDEGPYQEIAARIVDDFNNRDTSTFTRTFNVRAFFKEVFRDLDLKKEYKNNFQKGFRQKSHRIGDQILQHMPEDRYVKLLRINQDRNGAKALLRLDYGEQGIVYLDLFLKKAKSGKIIIFDWYDFGTGLKYSDSVRQFVLLTAPDPSALKQIFNIATGRKNKIKKIMALIKAKQKGDYEKVCSIYNSFDKELKQIKVLALINLDAANITGNSKLYADALRSFETYFGDDPTCSFMLINHYFLEKNYAKTIQALETFSAYVGIEDGAILSLKSSVLLEQEELKAASLVAEKGILVEPDYEDNYWTALYCYAGLEDYSKATSICRKLESKFLYNLTMEVFQEEETFQGLIQSKPFIAWMNAKDK